MTDSEIETFIAAFEDGSWPKSEWTHARHLIMALWYLSRFELTEATEKIREGIQSYNAHQGNATGYHETITRAFLQVIDGFLRTRDRRSPISRLAAELLESCGERDYLLRFYSRERLMSAEARADWIEPDLAPITTGATLTSA